MCLRGWCGNLWGERTRTNEKCGAMEQKLTEENIKNQRSDI